MKRRLLSLVLATSMIFGSVNVAFADEAASAETETIESGASESLDDGTVTDALASGGAAEGDGSSTTNPTELGIHWEATAPWLATVYGDAGGQSKIDNYGDPNFAEFKQYNGVTEFPYLFEEVADDIHLRMGNPKASDNDGKVESVGKIANGSEGRVAYYQQLTSEDDFTISATAHINGIDGTNNQVSFGAFVTDNIDPLVNNNGKPADSVNAGVRNIKNGASDIKKMSYGWTRANGTITDYTPETDENISVPQAGDDIKVKLTKSGTTYTLTYGSQKTTVDGSNLSMSDDIFVGLYVSRCADVTYSNVRLSVVGQPVEIAPYEFDGNGLNCLADKITNAKYSISKDNKDISLTLTNNTGKLSSSEDSYTFVATPAPSGEDFKLTTTLNSININPTSTFNQAAAGFMLFNDKYVKPGKIPDDEKPELRRGNTGKSVFVGLQPSDKSGTISQFVLRVNDGEKVTTTPLMNEKSFAGTATTEPINLTISKSGDILKVKVEGYDAVTTDVTGLFEDNQYIGYAVARAGELKVTNNDLYVGTKKVTSLSIESMPTKTTYYTTEKFDSTGLKLNATYADGSSEVIENADDFSLTGFDEGTSFKTAGKKVVYASIGKAKVEIPITVNAMKVTKIKVDYAPVYDTFYAGAKFNTVGFQVTASFEDGTSKQLNSNQYKLYLGDTVIDENTTFTSDMVGDDLAVIVKYTDATLESIDPNNATDAFYIAIKPGKLTALKIYTRDYKTTYYVGDELDTKGLAVHGLYTDESGNIEYQYINSSEYEVVGFDSSKVTEKQTLTVRLKDDNSIYDTYDIKVLNPEPIKVAVLGYPRLTYAVGEAFDASGLSYTILKTNNTNEELCADTFYYKDSQGYYKKANENGKVVGERVAVDEAEALAAGFYIDLTEFKNDAVGTSKVTFVTNSKYGIAAANPEVMEVSIVEPTDYLWKATLFGASCMGAAGQTDGESSFVTVNHTDNTSYTTDKDNYSNNHDLMENGELSNVKSVQVTSWTGSGKISGDQDGIAYYYTKVNANNNFVLSADVTVNRYIRDVNNLTPDLKKTYDSYIAQGDSPSLALDKLRSGQEAFGIMARDIVPFAGGVYNGEYMGGATNHMTPLPENAMTKETTVTKADGSTTTFETAVDLLDAYLNKRKVTDADGTTYEVSYANTEAQVTSNIVIAGGCSDSTFPTDPNLSSYYKKSTMNRINIMTRRGVVSTNGGGERVGIYSTTEKLPEAGDKYNITLTKLNTGYKITTYDYQTGKTVSKYSFETVDDTENVLEQQDANNIYVGFFAARFADMTVENIKLHETNADTDPIITADVDEAVAPKVTVSSPYYTTSTNYSLRLKSNSKKGMTGGITNISLNGKNVYKDVIVANKATTFDVELKPDYVNQFSVVYYPNTADNFTSYDPVITRFTVTHKTMEDTKKIYIGPNGTVNGDGSRDNPVNLETALGLVDFGGEIIMLDGTYHITDTDLGKIEIPETYSGYENGNFKTLRAEEGADPVIDLEGLYTGFEVDADYWLFKGFEVINSEGNEKAFSLGGKHVVVEDCTFHDNGTTGFQISRINSKDATIVDWPAYNVIKSCESYNNCDPSKNNADGFGSKLTVGYGNVFEDCISHHNLDDGWDCYTKINSGAIGAVVLENCVTYRQGYKLNSDGTETDFAGNSGGNGFKLGGEGIYVKHMLKDCITFNNKGNGVDSNNNPALKMRNVVAYKNQANNFSLYSNTANSLTDASGNGKDADGRVYKFDYDLKGAVSVGRPDLIGSWNNETQYGNISTTPIESESNYLNKDENNIKSVNSEGTVLDEKTFFKSTNASDGYDKATMRYNRAEDGSFIHGDFLARTEAYQHDAADIVTLPDVYGGEGGIGLNNGTTEATTETTTKATVHNSSGAGGGGKVKNYTTTTTTTETTTVSEDTTETTTAAPVLGSAISVKVGDKNITIDDKEFAMDVAPYIQSTSNSTMVPLRFVAIAIAGGSVDSADSSDIITWDAVAKTATINAGDKTVVFTAGARTYTLDGNTLNISNQAVAEIVDGRMFVPFRTIGEALGAKVSWDANTKTAKYN